MEIVACYIINGGSVSPITEMIQQHNGVDMIPTPYTVVPFVSEWPYQTRKTDDAERGGRPRKRNECNERNTTPQLTFTHSE